MGPLRPIWGLAALAAFAWLSAAPPAAALARIDRGFQAYLDGDYKAALKGLAPLARDGYAKAQYDLGSLYDNGAGVARDEAAAARWYRRAADQGNLLAEDRLGQMYARGLGVKRNLERAYFWFEEAAFQANGKLQNQIENERYRVVMEMTPRQLMAAMHMTVGWQPKRRARSPQAFAKSETHALDG